MNNIQEEIARAMREGENQRQFLIEQAQAEAQARAQEKKREEDQSIERFHKKAVDWLNGPFLKRVVSATAGGYTWLYYQDNRMLELKTETLYCKMEADIVKEEAEALGLKCELETFYHDEYKDYDCGHDAYETYRLKIHFA